MTDFSYSLMKRAHYLLSLDPEVNEDDALSVLPPPRGNHRSFVSAVNRGGGLSVIVFAINVSVFIVFAFIVSTIIVLHCFDYRIHCFHIVLTVKIMLKVCRNIIISKMWNYEIIVFTLFVD